MGKTTLSTKESLTAKDRSIEELKRGYIETATHYECLVCSKSFPKGEIFNINSRMYEAHRAVDYHIEEEHPPMEKCILELEASTIGITEAQKQVLFLFAEGLSDKEIAEKLGVAASTIRNHRHKLRDKVVQARIFLSLMELIEDKEEPSRREIDRTNGGSSPLGSKEKEKILQQYLTGIGRLESYPESEKSKLVILGWVIQIFSKNERYNECEINQELCNLYPDYGQIKRDLMTYGFLGKAERGDVFWVRSENLV